MGKVRFASLLLVAMSGGALADDLSRNVVLDNLHAKFSACVAFYTVKQRCRPGSDSDSRLTVSQRRADALAEAISMDPADAALRLHLNLAIQASLTGDDCGQIGTLERRYAADCDPWSSSPD